MQRFQFLFCWVFVRNQKLPVGVKQVPKPAQKTVYTVDAVRIPRFGKLQRPQEHLVQPKRICTVVFHNHIGIHHVKHRFRHLFDGPPANVLPVFQNKFSVLILGVPVAKSLHVQNIVMNNVYIHVYGRNIVLIFKVQRDKCVGLLNPVHKIASSLDHTLINEFPERLLLARDAQVEQEFIPEPAINQVSRRMFRPTDIEVYASPIVVSLCRHQCLAVSRIHVPQVVGR